MSAITNARRACIVIGLATIIGVALPSITASNASLTIFSSTFATISALLLFVVAYRRLEILRPVVIIPTLYLAYYTLGSLNISTYRGTVTPYLYQVVGLGILAYVAGVLVVDAVTGPIPPGPVTFQTASLAWRGTNARTLSLLGVIAGLVVVAVTIGLYGVPALQPFARFAVRPALIKASSILWLGAVLFFYRELCEHDRPRKRGWLLLLVCVVLVASLGYRTYVVMFALTILGLLYYLRRPSSRVVLFSALLVGLFAAGSWGVRFSAGEGRGIQLSDVFSRYDLPDGINPVLAIAYLQTREAVGLTQGIIDRTSTNGYLNGRLLVSDLLTVLPAEKADKITGGFLVVNYLGGTAVAGWAPSIVGAFFLDYGVTGVMVGLALLGVLLETAYLRMRTLRDSPSLIIYVYLLVASIDLMHRGIFAPDLIFHFAVLAGSTMWVERVGRGSLVTNQPLPRLKAGVA